MKDFAMEDTYQILKQLVEIPSPAGNTFEIISFIDEYLHALDIETKRNNRGALIVTLPGKDTHLHRLVTAHVDTLGAMVKEIKPSGRLTIDLIGGLTFNSIEGENCKIETSSGRVYTGTILMHQTSLHVYKDSAKAERNQANMEIRIDEKVTNADDVRSLGIKVGDFISFEPRMELTPSGFIKSRHLDDKVCVVIMLQLLKKLHKEEISLPYTTHFLFSNSEEIRYGGNASVPSETVEYLALDIGVIGDGQASDEYTVSICAKDSSGPYHLGLRKSLQHLAEKNNIAYNLDIFPFYGSDASAAIYAGHDIVHGLIGPGVDATHAYERTHLSSIQHTSSLLFYYLQSNLMENDRK
ncbi:M42 family metallopeptidase [Heyndrickxia sporothermodurans]|uniref:M42 family metallopeptidase n=2 Tax=Heyndrickxia sporothermodurans TaxID=46224 RepID=UPI0026C9135C